MHSMSGLSIYTTSWGILGLALNPHLRHDDSEALRLVMGNGGEVKWTLDTGPVTLKLGSDILSRSLNDAQEEFSHEIETYNWSLYHYLA